MISTAKIPDINLTEISTLRARVTMKDPGEKKETRTKEKKTAVKKKASPNQVV